MLAFDLCPYTSYISDPLKNLSYGPHGYWNSSANPEKQNSCFENSLMQQVRARALHSSASWAQHP